MEVLSVSGGRPLSGSLEICGAKNSILPLLAAALLTGGRCVFTGCPEISDVSAALAILEHLGCSTERLNTAVVVDCAGAEPRPIPSELTGRLRASVNFLGALLGRFGQGALAMPGGCCLGQRPIDYHLSALKTMGVQFTREGELLRFSWQQPCGGAVCLPFPSVGATENVLLAACGTDRQITLQGAAQEPEITELCRFLTAAGAELHGTGTDTLQIRGGAPLHGAVWRVMPDRMETATYLSLAAACGGRILLRNTRAEHLQPVLDALRQAGCRVEARKDQILLERSGALQAVDSIVTRPYPGFPTDAQAPLMAALLGAEGISRFRETVFPRRFDHVPQLRLFGGQIELCGELATVTGTSALHGARAMATDLRGGAAVLIAALAASGRSRISGTEHIHRGYASIVENLRALGADISCTNS